MPKSNVIIIFHCEFSSERAPRAYNFFRNTDRTANVYPNLTYPNIYLMKGGYESFHNNFKFFCTKPKDNHIKKKGDKSIIRIDLLQSQGEDKTDPSKSKTNYEKVHEEISDLFKIDLLNQKKWKNK